MGTHNKSQIVKIGIVTNEFFDSKIGGFGGFGWLAREAVFSLTKNRQQDVEVIFLSGLPNNPDGFTEYGTRIIFPNHNWEDYVNKLRAEKFDLLLSIDYRPSFDYPISALPDTPLIIWIQDPRPLSDIDKINTLTIPNVDTSAVQGIDAIDCTSLAGVVQMAIKSRRSLTFASPAPDLLPKVEGTYGITLQEADILFLPYPLQIIPRTIEKGEKPIVIFLGRLDPIKRPWIFVELGRLFPNVDFYLLGKSHFDSIGVPPIVPENVKYLGHVDGVEKEKILTSAWLLVNTSIHEALPVSFLEALLFQMPIVSCQNPENLVSKYGFYTGRFDGDGLAGLSKFAEGLSWLLGDDEVRLATGKAGREWVESNHTRSNFIAQFERLFNQPAEKNVQNNDTIPQPWGVPRESYWSYQIAVEVNNVITDDQPFILVDDNKLPRDLFKMTRILPFLEKDGEFFGAPANDRSAIEELEKLRKRGTSYIVIAWPAFWWLDYYKKWHEYIRTNFACIMENERFIVFDLRGSLGKSNDGEDSWAYVSK